VPSPVALDERKAEIRRDLVDAQTGLLQALDRVGADGWSLVSPNEGWTVHSLLTHLATSEAGFVASMSRQASGAGGLPADFDPNRWNAGQVRRRAESAPLDLRTELETAHVRLLSLLDSLGPDELDRRGHLSTGGDGSVEDGLRLSARHKREHTDDILAALSARV
jgi:uncharacterized protein (TIGR03083 family)